MGGCCNCRKRSARRPAAALLTSPLAHAQGRDGLVAWWGWPLFWPYHLALRVKLHYQRWSSTEPLYSSIADGWCEASHCSHQDHSSVVKRERTDRDHCWSAN